jgi:hypothetical protein
MNDSPDRPEVPKPLIPPYRCSDCGSESGFRSRRRTFTEKVILRILLLQPVRCGECFRREYRSRFVKVRARLSETPTRIMPKKPPATSNRNVA